MSTPLRLVRILPELLGINGSLGNAEVLQVRAQWWSVPVEVTDVWEGQPLPPSADIVLLGHGTSSAAARAAASIETWRDELHALYTRGSSVVGVGLGGDLLGQSLRVGQQQLSGAGLTPGRATLQATKVSSEVVGIDSDGRDIAGYLNDLTEREAVSTPLCTLQRPRSLRDTDGYRAERIWVSSLSGPLLALNPHLADDILSTHRTLPAPTEQHVAADTAAAMARAAIAARLGA